MLTIYTLNQILLIDNEIRLRTKQRGILIIKVGYNYEIQLL